MKFGRWMILVVAVGVGGAACTGTPQRDARVSADGGSQAQAATTAVDSVVYVDVRTDSEYAAGHVEGALHIPYDQMEQRYGELEPYADQEIVLYCRSGHRAGIAQGVLEERGFGDVVNGGGITDLQSEGVATTADR